MAAAVGRMSGHWTCLKNQGTTVSSRQFSIFRAHFPRHQSKHTHKPTIQTSINVFPTYSISLLYVRNLMLLHATIVINYMIIHTPASVVL